MSTWHRIGAGVVLLTLAAGSARAVELDNPETWSGGTVAGWQCGRLYTANENARLSVVEQALTMTFPAGPNSGSPPVPLTMAFLADAGGSGGRFVGDALAAGAGVLQFDFYGSHTPVKCSVELWNQTLGTNGQGCLFLAEFSAVTNWQRIVVALAMPPFNMHSSWKPFFVAPYDDEFEATTTNITRLFIRVSRSNTATDAPQESYRIDNVVWSASAPSAYETWAETFGVAFTNRAEDVDFDGDGVPNGDEFVADTDPTDSNACFRLHFPAPQTLRLDGASNRVYRVYYRPELAEGSWTNLVDIWTNRADGQVERQLPEPGAQAKAFYKAEVELE